MQSPVRIAQGKKGRLYVSDYLTETIIELEAGPGAVYAAAAFTVPGKPLAVAWARGNRLLVGNSTTKSVDVYQATSGRWLYSLGGQGSVSDPSDIAIDAKRKYAFVVDGDAGVVKVFDLKRGFLVRTISGPGPGPSYLQNPTGIAVDETRQQVLVADYGDPDQPDSPPAVKVFSYDGTHVQTIAGKSGMLGARFSRPQGLAVAGSGRIFLVDALAGEILVLDRETGSVLATLGRRGSGPGELRRTTIRTVQLALDRGCHTHANAFNP
jgi:DNA-binding beta-propeller fold protein YncE